MTAIREVGKSSSSVVEAVESAVRGRGILGYALLSLVCAEEILDGSPWIGWVTMGTGGGTLDIGRGVGRSKEPAGLVGEGAMTDSTYEPL